MKGSRGDLTEGSIIRNIWHLALPMMVGNVLQNAFSIVDMKFVGKLGPSAIAAVSVSGIVMAILFIAVIGINMGTVAMVSRFVGAKKYADAEATAMQSLILGGFCYAIVAIGGYPLAASVLRILGAKDDVVAQGVEYVRIMFLGSFTMILGFILGSILRSCGDAVTPLKALVISTLLNIVLDPLLIFGVWKFPRLGIAGSALATVIARAIGAGILFWVFLRGNAAISLRMTDRKIDFPLMWRIMKIGIFASVQATMRNVSGAVLMPIVAAYGTAAIAAYGIGMRVQMLTLMVAFGLGNAVSTLVGQNLGAQKPDRAEKTAWITVAVGAGIMTFMGIMYVVFSKAILGFFSSDAQVIATGSTYMRIVAGTYGFIGLSIILGRALNGAGDTISPMVTTAITFVGLRTSLALLLSWLVGLNGVWFALTISIIVQGLAMSLWFKTGRWKLKEV